MITSPPLAALKKLVPITRSNRLMSCEPAMKGVPKTTSAEVVAFAQTSSGIRQTVMPGARMVTIVTMKFSAVAMVDAPANWIAISNMVVPVVPCSASVGYAVQPDEKAPNSGANASSAMATTSSQNESAFRRGNAMSLAPIMSGRT